MRLGRSLPWLIAALASGCDGLIGGMPDGSDGECTTTASPGAPVPMRRLTAPQVERSVNDVLGVALELRVVDEKIFTFKSNVSTSVDFVGARGYLDFAEEAVALADLSACAEAGADCSAWLFDDVGARLFRRSLLDEERARYQATFDEGASEGGSLEGARWVLEAMLQSPSLLYLDEVTREDGYLDDHSMAARLALTLWGSNPDAALLERARRGELATPEGIAAEAARMLDDPRSLGGLTDFVDQWLRLERLDNPDARPDLEALGEETLAAMRSEPVQLMRLLVHTDGNVAALLTSSDTVPLPDLAPIYGGDVIESSAEVTRLDPGRRAGILSLPGVMAALSHAEGTSPTLRGYAVLANFLCTPPSPPPAGVNVTLPDIGGEKSTRERLEAHFSDPSCASCHKPMDGIGFAFEGIDWIGRSRDEEFGKPIDDTSTFPLGGQEVTVEGAPGIAAVMADSPDVGLCIARQWASYGGGVPDKEEAECLVESLAVLAAEPGGLRKMILGFVTSDWYRKGPGELP
jgi:hypothetical protein